MVFSLSLISLFRNPRSSRLESNDPYEDVGKLYYTNFKPNYENLFGRHPI